MIPPVLAASLEIHAPPSALLQALSRPEQLATWLLPPGFPATLTLDGETLHADLGPMQAELLHVALLEAGRGVRWTALPEAQISALITLQERSESSAQVLVSLEGYEKLPALPGEERMALSLAAWPRALENLAAAAAGRELPWPEGQLAALFGFRRETSPGPEQLLAVERSVLLNVPIARAWAAISEPAQIEGWFSPGTRWQLTGLAPGGRLFVRGEDGGEMYTQIVDTVEAPSLLVLRTPPDDNGFFDRSRYTLQSEGSCTRATLTYSGFDKLPAAERAAAMEQTAFGFGMVMENLRAFAEGRALPVPGGF